MYVRQTCLINNISITEILSLLPPGGVVLAVDSGDVVDVRVLVEVTSVSTNADYHWRERSQLLLQIFIPSECDRFARKFSKCLAVIMLRYYLLTSLQNLNAEFKYRACYSLQCLPPAPYNRV